MPLEPPTPRLQEKWFKQLYRVLLPQYYEYADNCVFKLMLQYTITAVTANKSLRVAFLVTTTNDNAPTSSSINLI